MFMNRRLRRRARKLAVRAAAEAAMAARYAAAHAGGFRIPLCCETSEAQDGRLVVRPCAAHSD